MTHYHHLAYSRSWLDDELYAAVQLLKALAETTPCRPDHEGLCQAHALEPVAECSHRAAQEFLTRHP